MINFIAKLFGFGSDDGLNKDLSPYSSERSCNICEKKSDSDDNEEFNFDYVEDALLHILDKRTDYEERYNFKLSYQVIHLSVKLANKYMDYYRLVDCVEEIFKNVSFNVQDKLLQINEFKDMFDQIAKLILMKRCAIESQQFEQAQIFNAEEFELRRKILEKSTIVVDEDMIIRVVSDMTGIKESELRY